MPTVWIRKGLGKRRKTWAQDLHAPNYPHSWFLGLDEPPKPYNLKIQLKEGGGIGSSLLQKKVLVAEKVSASTMKPGRRASASHS